MCDFNLSNDGRRIDPCMQKVIGNLQSLGVRTLACCCGHDVYPMTLVVDIGEDIGRVVPIEIFSGKVLLRKKKFYKKDSKGRYYIPEVQEELRDG